MDRVLQTERGDGYFKRKHSMLIGDLPDGTMIERAGAAWAIRGKNLLRWKPEGYGERRRRPEHQEVLVLTPPSIVKVLTAGYRPQWHPSASVPTLLGNG
jgi:hypothetical protein